MKKRLVSLLLVLVCLISMLPVSGCGADAEGVTRGEWISMLADAFGMTSYTEDSPRYNDISTESSLYPYVQSAAEWDVLAIFGGTEFEPDKTITAEEVASTAAIAAGWEISEDQFDADGAFDPDQSVSFSQDNGIIAKGKRLSASMTLEECSEALEAARKAYLTAPFKEKKIAVRNDRVIDLTDLPDDDIRVDESDIIVSGDVSRDVSGELIATVDTASGSMDVGVGDVFIAPPTQEDPEGVAYKVTAIEEINGEIVIHTEEPTLEDLYDELDVHVTVEAKPEDVIWHVGDGQGYAGEINSNGNGSYSVSLLTATEGDYRATQLGKSAEFHRSFTFGNGNFKKTYSSNSSALGAGEGAKAFENSNFVYDKTPSIDDFNGSTDSWTKDLTVENSFSGGYKITGDIIINGITVTPEIKFKKALGVPYGIKKASVQISSDITARLTLEGELSETLKIATVPIPVTAGITVSVELYLCADANGSLVVTAGLGTSSKIEYANGKLRRSSESQANATAEAAIEINFGAKLAAYLKAAGIKIVDISVRVGGVLEADAHVSGSCKVSEEDGVAKMTYQQSMVITADLFVPTIKLSAGGSDTLIGKLKVGGSWDIISKKNAKQITLMDYEWVFWEEVVLMDSDGDVVESESTTAGEQDGVGSTDEDRLDLKAYVVTVLDGPVQLELDLREGEEAPQVIWVSADPSIATVDQNGVVTPVSSGYTIITAILESNHDIYVSCAVYIDILDNNDWEFLPSDLPGTV